LTPQALVVGLRIRSLPLRATSVARTSLVLLGALGLSAGAEERSHDERLLDAWRTRMRAVLPVLGDATVSELRWRDARWKKHHNKMPDPERWPHPGDFSPTRFWAPNDSAFVDYHGCSGDVDSNFFLSSLTDTLSSVPFACFGPSLSLLDLFWYDAHTVVYTARESGWGSVPASVGCGIYDARHDRVASGTVHITGAVPEESRVEMEICAWRAALRRLPE
jgi:hypothetical protein